MSVPPTNTSVVCPRTTTLPRDENQCVTGRPLALGNLSGSDVGMTRGKIALLLMS